MTAKNHNETKSEATKAKRTRKARRQLPENKDDLYIGKGESPTLLDVVSGRGGGSNHHEGNQRYWRQILTRRPTYRLLGADDKAEKTAIAESIRNYITEHGRFLQKEAKTGRWFVLPQKIVLDKIKQALRDKYVPEFARSEVMKTTLEPTQTLLPPPPLPPLKIPSTDLMTFNSTDFESFLKPQLSSIDVSQQHRFATTDALTARIGNPPSLNINDFLQHYKSNDSLGQLQGSSFLSSDAFKSLNNMGSKTNFNHPFNVFSKSNNFPSTDDLKIEIGKLERGSLDHALKGHSLDLMASGGSSFPRDAASFQNSCTVPNKLSSYFNAKFEEAFASLASTSPVQAI
jgi:hypothetical protein